MSHIHFPDGILPVWLWLGGYVIVIFYLIWFGKFFKKHHSENKLPLVGVFAALMLIAMSIEIVPIGYHINLAVLSGIILGPFFSVLTIFIVTFILSLLGHGGITVVGLNTLTISIEAIVGWLIYRTLKTYIKKIFYLGFTSSIIALFISTMVTISIVYLGTHSIESLMHVHQNSKQQSYFLSSHLFEHHDHEHELEVQSENNHDHNHHIENTNNHENNDHNESKKAKFDIVRFIFLLLGLGFIGWILEGLVTAFIINYIYKIKPDLLDANK